MQCPLPPESHFASIDKRAQFAFVPGRAITGKVVAAFELIYYMKRKACGKFGDVALKIDIIKAYDRLSWRYLEAILTKMGFHTRWIECITLCVSTVSYYVSVNGELVDPITPKRGLRQGDPFSPYLFILCAEGLSSLMKQVEERGKYMAAEYVEELPTSPTYYVPTIVSSSSGQMSLRRGSCTIF